MSIVFLLLSQAKVVIILFQFHEYPINWCFCHSWGLYELNDTWNQHSVGPLHTCLQHKWQIVVKYCIQFLPCYSNLEIWFMVTIHGNQLLWTKSPNSNNVDQYHELVPPLNANFSNICHSFQPLVILRDNSSQYHNQIINRCILPWSFGQMNKKYHK